MKPTRLLIHYIASACILLCMTGHAYAQTYTVMISGTNTSDAGETKNYSAVWRLNGASSSPPSGGSFEWHVTSGGEIISQSATSINITWHTTGNKTITYSYSKSGTNWNDTHAVTVSGTVPSVPATTFTQTQYCMSTDVTRNTNPPAGAEWFWQTSSSGFSTALGSAATINRTTSGNLWLRARNATAPYGWSSTLQSVGSVTVLTTPPATPATANHGEVIYQTGTTVNLSVSTVAGATSYQWFTVSSGGTAIAGATTNSYSPAVTQTQSFYVQSVNGPCVSASRREVIATVYPEPILAATNNASITMSIPVTLSLGNAYDTYKWKKNGVYIPGATAATYVASSPGSYQVEVTKGAAAAVTSVAIVVTYGQAWLDKNFVSDYAIKKAGVTTADVDTLSAASLSQTVQYVDGLGRPWQKVVTQGSPDRRDVVQPSAYNAFGKETEKYLPYAAADGSGWVKEDFLPKTHANYNTSPQYLFYQSATGITADTRPYTEIDYEDSPLNRPLKEFGPGQAWSNKPVEQQYLTNLHNTGTSAAGEKVIAWKVTNNLPVRRGVQAGFIETGGYYSSGQLTVNVTIDEQGNSVREYKDKQGRIVLKKVQAVASSVNLNSVTEWALTYYVYDDLGNLRYVFQPELGKILHGSDTAAANSARRNAWAFEYTYDSRMRMATKKVPGAGVVYMVYDMRNRLVLTQDANQRSGSNKYWMFTKYDVLNRPVLTGIHTADSVLSQAKMQRRVNVFYNSGIPYEVSGSVVHGYTNQSYPSESNANNYLTVTYYDTYAFKTTIADSSLYSFQHNHLTGQRASYFKRLTGQVTGSKVKVLDGAGITGGSSWLKTVNYYDDYYRLIQVVADNYKQGRDRITSVYDFTGNVLKTKATHDEYDVAWKDFTSGVALLGERLYRSLGGSDNNQGAASIALLPANTDGWFEFTHSNANSMFIGFSANNTDPAFTSIEYCLGVGGTTYTARMSGGAATNVGAHALGDVFRIERVSGTVRIRKNGAITHTFSGSSTSALLVDVSFVSGQSSVLYARASFTSSTHSTERTFTYDHNNRLLEVWHKLDSEDAVLLTKNSYNELGQLIDKKLHSSDEGETYKQSVDHTYNIRGWLTKINESDLSVADDDANRDLFGMQLLYNESDAISNTPLYNGNISGTKWSNNQALGDLKQNAYVYAYDPMNRITSSAYKEKTATWTAATNNGNAETGFTYDLNGNIKTLQRNDRRASGWMDNLTYDYGTTASNKLLKVVDTGDDYAGFVDGPNAGNDYNYDANGNMTLDLNKGISTAITYNVLNLPEAVTRGAGNGIQYIYDAGGRKLTQVTGYATVRKRTDYAGEYQYEDDVLQHVSHEEGRIVLTKTETVYTNSADATTRMTAATSTLAAITQNGSTYVRAVANGTTSKQGIFPIGDTFTVQAGEVYRIRAKGYRSVTSNNVFLNIRINGNDVSWPGTQLAPSPDTEAWVEQTVTIPPGGTSLEAGVIWNTTANSQAFFLNEFEVMKLSTNEPEYQYNLKDHLGNVRVSFTTKHATDTSLATMETANSSDEQGGFLYYNEAVKINATLFDHTNSGSTHYATRLTGSANERYGLAKSMSVMPGDTVRATVYAKYLDTNNANWTTALNNLMTAIANGTAPGGTLVDGGMTGSTGGATPPHAGVISKGSETGTAPKAYLNFLVFNKDMTTVLDGGFVRLTEAGREYGQDGAHEELFKELVITEPGYVYLYLSNDNYALGGPMIEVYFDDFTVEHVKSPIVQADDYYAFGLTFNSYNRENSIPNQYKLKGKEWQDELNLNVYAFGFRDYDPALGRWHVIDQLSEKYHTTSPYAFVQNNPIINREIDGRYFEGKNEKKAARLERKAERRAGKLEAKATRIEAKGKDSGDLRARAGELRQSGQDIRDMRSNTNTEYRYANFGGKESRELGLAGPSTTLTGQNSRGDNVVTMFTLSEVGSKLHETRHGGQDARGEYDIATGANYGVADEISAFRAAYSWNGQLKYRDEPTLEVIQQRLGAGSEPTIGTINNINQITGNIVNSMVDPGFKLIYPPRDTHGNLIVPLDVWNRN